MFDKLLLLLVLFIVLVYLANSRSIRQIELQMIVSGEKKVDDPDNERQIIEKHIRWYSNGMVALCFILLIVGVVALREYGLMLF